MKKLILLWVLSVAITQADWPQWRGPGGQGHAVGNLPIEWSETKNVSWKTSLPGRGWSSPVIAGSQIWLTTAIEEEASAEEAKERLKVNTGDQKLTLLNRVELRALCVDRDSGKLLHNILLLEIQRPQWVHAQNSYASPTPVLDNGRLHCHFGTFGTVCVDTAAASVLWKNTEHEIMHENGPGSSPVVWKDKVIFHCDGSDVQFIVALDAGTGKTAWKTIRSGEMHENPQLKKAYGTPLITTISGHPLVLSPAANWLYAYDPETGKEKWKFSYGRLGFSNVPRPVHGNGLLYICTGFMRPELMAVRPGAEGCEEVWRYARNVPTTPSPILVGGEIYIVSDQGGVVSCVDALTGESHWRERLPDSSNHNGSPLHADGNIYFHARNGLTTVLKEGKEFKTLSQNRLDGQIFTSAAAMGNALFIRTDKALYRIEETQ